MVVYFSAINIIRMMFLYVQAVCHFWKKKFCNLSFAIRPTFFLKLMPPNILSQDSDGELLLCVEAF